MGEITAPVLQGFLEDLGRRFRYPGRLYLVGGTSLILVDAKVSTLDVNVKIEVSAEHKDELVRCLRETGRQSQLSVEQASPDQYIPLPRGHEGRHRFVGRFGSLDVFHFDFYSVALSKLLRGNEKDYEDVVQMVWTNLIALEQLQLYFFEVLPQLETFRVGADPEEFESNFAEFERRLSQE